MAKQAGQESGTELDEVNAKLRRGLKLCHSLVDDYRLKLAANSNDTQADIEDDDNDEDTQLG